MKNTRIILLVAGMGLMALAAQACGDDETSSGSGTTTNPTSSSSGATSSSTSGMPSSSSAGGAGGAGGTGGAGGAGGSGGSGLPAPPRLGAQIDRFGRPAINTATNHTFDVDMAKKDAAK